MFKGSKGYLTCGVYGESPRLLPESQMRDFAKPEPTLRVIEGSHEAEWCDAIRNNRPANAEFGYSGFQTEIVQLGNIAKRMNTKLLWDAEKMEFTNVPEATNYVRQPYRDGWSIRPKPVNGRRRHIHVIRTDGKLDVEGQFVATRVQ